MFQGVVRCCQKGELCIPFDGRNGYDVAGTRGVADGQAQKKDNRSPKIDDATLQMIALIMPQSACARNAGATCELTADMVSLRKLEGVTKGQADVRPTTPFRVPGLRTSNMLG